VSLVGAGGLGNFRREYPDNLSRIANLGPRFAYCLMNGEGLRFPAFTIQNGMYSFLTGLWHHVFCKPYHQKGVAIPFEKRSFCLGVPLAIGPME